MSDELAAAERLLKAIDGVHCGVQVTPGQWIKTEDVIAVCRKLLAEQEASLESRLAAVERERDFAERYRIDIAKTAGCSESSHWGDIATVISAKVRNLQSQLTAAQARIAALEKQGRSDG